MEMMANPQLCAAAEKALGLDGRRGEDPKNDSSGPPRRRSQDERCQALVQKAMPFGSTERRERVDRSKVVTPEQMAGLRRLNEYDIRLYGEAGWRRRVGSSSPVLGRGGGVA